jgi:hypothetical protein
MKRLFTAAMLLVVTAISANAQLVINELMQSNVECFFDNVTKEFPDSWVELYNSGTATVYLQDYQISNKNKANKAWQLPEQEIPAGGHVIIYCDKEGLKDNRLHTDFRLESGKGCTVYLFKNKGSVPVDSLPYVDGKPMVKMPAPDVAFGRKTDGANEWGYQLTPTPGNANTGQICNAKKILGAPYFSEKGHVCNTTVNLTLSVPEGAPDGTYFTYTTNGEEPKATGEHFNNPVNLNITSTTVIRAKLFCEGWLSPVSTAQSYIFHPRAMKVPIISILTNDDYINDDDIGIYPNNTGKYDKVDWRRPINIEMFEAAGEASVINQLGETRIQGGKSRENALKSMAIYTNKRFDPDKKRFSYELFPDQKPGITEFKSFTLRDGGNDFTDLYFRDLIIQSTMGPNVDLDWQAGRPAVVYINGVFKGMLNIRERSNADNIYSNYDGLEDIDMIEISHEDATGVDEYIEELKEGTMDFYDEFWAFYSEGYEQGITPDYSLEEYEEWMDVSEYLNVMITNLFFCNIDFPGNNIVFWRPNDDDKDSGLPKRWRFIVKDTDFGLGLYNFTETSRSSNTIDMIYNPDKHGNTWAFSNPKASLLFRNMMANTDIKNMFIDKSCVFMGDFMNAEGTGAVIDDIKDKVLDEFVAHRQLYPSWGGNNEQEITQKFENAKKWVAGYKQGHTTVQPRSYYFLQHISKQYLNSVSSVPVTINLTDNNQPIDDLPNEVYVNGIKLTRGVFNGDLFLNRDITLEAKNNIENDYSVTGWEIKKNGVSEEPVEGTTYNFTVPSCSKLEINAVKVHKPQVTISEYGAVSFSSTKPLDFTNMPDLKAYIVTEQNGNKFIKEQVYKVPANTGLVIEGKEGTYKIPVACSNTSFDTVSNNLLRPTSTGAFTVPDDGNVYYGLFYSNIRQTVGFQQKVHPYTFDVNKSYLCLTQQQLGKEMPEIFFGETISGVATNIQGVDNDTWTDGKVYNLNGQRVDKNYNGVIIVNGKKVVNNRK